MPAANVPGYSGTEGGIAAARPDFVLFPAFIFLYLRRIDF